MRNQLFVSALMVASAAASAKAGEPAMPVKVRPAVYAATSADVGTIQNVAWRRYAYRPYYGGYAYRRPYAYRTYRPYYNGGYYAQPFYNGGYGGGYYGGGYYGGYGPLNYGNYYGPGVRYGWRRGGAYYW